MSGISSLWRMILPSAFAILLSGCAGFLPSGGPLASTVRNAHPDSTGIQVVDLNSSVASRLEELHQPQTFPEEFRRDEGPDNVVEPGDELEVTVMEAPPTALFGVASSSAGSSGSPGSTGAQAVSFPEQYISSAGIIYLPFAGEIHAAGKTLQQVEDDITSRLKEKANQPQVLVRLVGNNTNYVTVLGAVTTPTHFSLTAARERLLDALAKAGSGSGTVGGDVRNFTVQVTRGARSVTVPLARITRDSSQNIILRGGDVITVMHQPYNFTVMGATARNQEYPFEGPYITLDEALARCGSLNEQEANIRGVFVFRFERPDALDWPHPPVTLTNSGKVRVVYCLDLSKPASFFAAKAFPVCDGDLIYTAHASSVGLQRLLEIAGSITSPALNSAYQGAVTVNAVAP